MVIKAKRPRVKFYYWYSSGVGYFKTKTPFLIEDDLQDLKSVTVSDFIKKTPQHKQHEQAQ